MTGDDIDLWDSAEASTPPVFDTVEAEQTQASNISVAEPTEAETKPKLRTIDCGNGRYVKENKDGTWSPYGFAGAHRVVPFDDWSDACQHAMRA